ILLRQSNALDADGRRVERRAAYARNVAGFGDERDFFPAKVFSAAARWWADNLEHDQRLLVVDSFDVHEPFHIPEPYASMYTAEDPRDPDLVSWPLYGRTDQGASKLSERQIAFVRAQYAGKLTMADRWLGELFDELDRSKAWNDTMVIVTTDHGHYLGDHGWMGKGTAPLYDVLAHPPLMVWQPGSPRMGQRVSALTSAVDLYATMLDALDIPVPVSSHGRSLLPLLRGETDRVRDWALYGYWGSTMNVTDGRWTYHQPCRDDIPAYLYSTMMLNPWDWFAPARPQPDAESGRFLPYTDAPVWRYPAKSQRRHDEPLLFDVERDPGQVENLAEREPAQAQAMRELMVTALRELSAPDEQYERLSLV
nr:sulfatase-like hydrolase/transferase [Chloroflexia bacterium]